MSRSPWWSLLIICVIAASVVRIVVDRIWLPPLPTTADALRAELSQDSLDVSQHPTSFRPQARLAFVLLRLGQVAEAEAPARRAVALAPRQALAHSTLGAVLITENQAKPALDELMIAFQRGARDRMTYVMLAGAEDMNRQDSAASRTFAEAASRWPSDPFVVSAYTWFLIRKSRPNALDYAGRLQKLAPGWAGSYAMLSKAYAARSDAHHARQYMLRATELAPGYMVYWADLGDYSLLDGDTAAAWTALSKARAIDSTHFDAMSVYRHMWATVNAAHH